MEYPDLNKCDNETDAEKMYLIEDDLKIRKLLKYQYHRHIQNKCWNECDKIGHKICKNNFPKPIFDNTHILLPFEKETNQSKAFKHAKKNFLIIRAHLYALVEAQSSAIKKNKPIPRVIRETEFLNFLNMTQKEYINAIRTTILRTTVFLKRNSHEISFNNYNRDILLRHRANMDIQYVFDSYSVAIYLTSYMMKSQALMSRVLRNASEELKKGNMSIREKLSHIAQKFQNCSEIGAQECVYHLLSMPVSHCSRDTIFIMTFPLKDRYLMLKDPKILKRMNPSSKEVYQSTLFDYYAQRPDTMENMCLTEFAASYNYISNERYKILKFDKIPHFSDLEDNEDDDDFNKLNDENEIIKEFDNYQKTNSILDDDDYIALKNKRGYLRLRKTLKIIDCRRYNKAKEPDQYYREQLLLYKPWRNERAEIENVDYLCEYNKYKDIIIDNRKKFEFNFNDPDDEDDVDVEELFQQFEKMYEDAEEKQAEELDKATRILVDSNIKKKPENKDNSEDSEICQDQDNSLNIENLEEKYGYHSILFEPTLKLMAKNKKEENLFCYQKPSNQEFMLSMTTLNRQQHKYIVNMLYLLRCDKSFYHFITGYAGTGKSRLIRAINESANIFYQSIESSNSDYDESDIISIDSDDFTASNKTDTPSHVLLSSYTGRAAFNVRGTTLHSAFHLGQNEASNYVKLNALTLKKARNEFKNIKLLIIDEISMVGIRLLTKVDQRLREIFRKDCVFGGLNVIVLGDFNQLNPVGDPPIYCSNATYDTLVSTTNYLWDNFELFELTEIMRQRNDLAFAKALTTLGIHGLIGLSDSEIALFDSRIVTNTDEIPQDAIYLFSQNKNVDAHNRKKITEMPGELFINIAQDVFHGNEEERKKAEQALRNLKHLPRTKTNMMPYELFLKINAKYMITSNFDISDGIVNGTCGTLKRIEYDQKIAQAITLWFDFYEQDIGVKQRKKADLLLQTIGFRIENGWTPIQPQELIFKVNKTTKWSIKRTQFQLIECEAITIHKSQGQTFQCVAVDLGTYLTKQLLYVAFSRAQKLSDLHLYGKKSLVEGSSFLKYSKEQREIMKNKAFEMNPVQIELKRLRSSKLLCNVFPFLETTNQSKYLYNSYNSEAMLFHSIEGLEEKTAYIQNDFGFNSADFLIITNCHFHNKTPIDLKNFKQLTQPTQCKEQKCVNACGTTIYLKHNCNNLKLLRFENIDSMQVHVLTLNLKLSDAFLICFTSNSFTKCFNKYLDLIYELIPSRNEQFLHPVFIFYNGKTIGSNVLAELKTRMNIKLSNKVIKTKNHNWCLTNVDGNNHKLIEYDSFSTRCNPIWIYIKKDMHQHYT